jgi:DNA-binding NarL/FixJ family response regulator
LTYSWGRDNLVPKYEGEPKVREKEPEKMKARLLITDDHDVVRQGLRLYLRRDPEIEVVGEAADGEEAVELAQSLRPDVVLMDLLMPRMDGIAATEAIRAELPRGGGRCAHQRPGGCCGERSNQGRAIGYLLKDTKAEALCWAIKGAAAGQVQLAPKAAARLMREVRIPESPEALTERETAILKRVARGEANKEIACALFVEERTVKSHVSSILKKLGVKSRTQAALHAVRTGLVAVDELSEESW